MKTSMAATIMQRNITFQCDRCVALIIPRRIRENELFRVKETMITLFNVE